jgi:hypothetical protein
MKTSKLRAIFITVLIAASFAPGISMAQRGGSATVVNFPNEKSNISRDAANIRLQRERIDVLKQRCKDARAAHDAKAQAAVTADIRKASADLKMQKAYLRADKMELIDNHNIAIADRKKQIRDDKCMIRTTRKELDKNLEQGNNEAAEKNVALIAASQKELNNDKALLQEQKVSKNNDIISINEVIRKSDGQYAAVLKAESSVAAAKNRMEK